MRPGCTRTQVVIRFIRTWYVDVRVCLYIIHIYMYIYIYAYIYIYIYIHVIFTYIYTLNN